MTSIAEVRLLVNGFKNLRELKGAMIAGAVVFRDAKVYSNGSPVLLIAERAKVKA